MLTSDYLSPKNSKKFISLNFFVLVAVLTFFIFNFLDIFIFEISRSCPKFVFDFHTGASLQPNLQSYPTQSDIAASFGGHSSAESGAIAGHLSVAARGCAAASGAQKMRK